MPRFAILILSGLIVLLAALLVVAAILSPSLSVRDLLVETDDAIIITIPAGTDAAFDRGEDVSIIHGDLFFTIGERDRLIIINEDIAPHVIGPFYIRPETTLEHQYTTPQIYETYCSFQLEGLRIIVREA